MDLSDRLSWLLLGMAIGFVLGVIVTRLRVIEKKVDVVGDHIKKHTNDERGFMRHPVVADVLYFLVLLIVVWGAFSAQKATNEAQSAQRQLQRTVECIREYNTHLGESLSTRDSAIKAGTQSEIELWTKYAKLYALAKRDPSKIPQAQEALNRAIMSHRDALTETQTTRERNPYPDPDVLKSCKEN